MGIKRSVEWKLICPPDEADTRMRKAFGDLDLSPDGPPGTITGHSKRSMIRNRWAADVTVVIEALGGGSMALTTVDMAGNKHYAVLSDLAEALGDDLFDDRGVRSAVERLGKAGRLFGRKEVRHLKNLLRANEEVLELGQGQYEGKQGLVVLTTERLFFFEKSMGSETIEEFPLQVISSLSVNKKVTGETLKIFASGNNAEIGSMMHGQGDALVRRFHNQKQKSSTVSPTSAAASTDDPMSQLERLGQLKEKGLISEEEFQDKKADLLRRL